MKTHIALGAALLLTLGTAVAGTLMYGHTQSPDSHQWIESAAAPSNATPDMIAVWKATADSTDYIAPKAPI